jgi:hypothetical protein
MKRDEVGDLFDDFVSSVFGLLCCVLLCLLCMAACIPQCLQCSSSSDCSKCVNGFVFNGSSCVNTCPDGYFKTATECSGLFFF